jgi:hypothetical protein
MTKANLTGPKLIQLFKDYSESTHKLFIPDPPREDAVADTLCKHYNHDDLEAAVKWHIDNEQGPFLVFDFAVQSRILVDKVKFERLSVDRFKDIVEETRKRMEKS